MASVNNNIEKKSAGERIEDSIKKPLIKNNTLFTLIIVIGVIIAIVIFGISLVKSKLNGDDSSSKLTNQKCQKIADNMSYMIESADLDIKYVNSEKRTLLSLIGSDGYYSIQFSNNKIYFAEGKYSISAQTNEQKIAEANTNITNGQKVFASDITSFSVDNYNVAKDSFDDGTVSITFGIEGMSTRTTVVANIPK